MNLFRLLFKNLLRAVVDSCILPGTTLGTEILWLYAKEWKKELSTTFFAISSIGFFYMVFPADARSVISQIFTGR